MVGVLLIGVPSEKAVVAGIAHPVPVRVLLPWVGNAGAIVGVVRYAIAVTVPHTAAIDTVMNTPAVRLAAVRGALVQVIAVRSRSSLADPAAARVVRCAGVAVVAG